MPDIFDPDEIDDAEENYRPRPFEDGFVPGWYAMTPDGAVADARRYALWADINRDIELGRLGLRQDQGTLIARYLSPEGWLDEEQSNWVREAEAQSAVSRALDELGEAIIRAIHSDIRAIHSDPLGAALRLLLMLSLVAFIIVWSTYVFHMLHHIGVIH